MKRITFLYLFVLYTVFCYSQENYKIRTIAFYNLENLFDTVDDPEIKDEEGPILKIKVNRDTVYSNKIHNLAKVISEIGTKEAKNCPTLVGVAEVENLQVLEDLISTPHLKNKNFGIIHFNSPDFRGIDVALLYQTDYFRPSHFESFELKLWNEKGYRLYTRDQLLVSGYLDGELIHIIVNHWPSRRGGEKKSRLNREKAASLNIQIIEKIKINDTNPKVIIMGDLNDNPNNTSLKHVLKTKKKKRSVKAGDIYNPYEDLFKRGFNSLVYNNNLCLFDQIMVTSPLLTTEKDYSSFKIWKANIFNPQYLTNQIGKYKGYPFRSFVGNNWNGGYSDHYPVYIHLIRRSK
jgi:hypothetical protein